MMDDFVFFDAWESISDNKTGYSFYPNPARDQIKIHSINQITHIEIRDITGTLVYEKNMGSSNFSVNIEDLKPGIYMYTLKFENGPTVIGKFMKIQ
jgi:hypothetical protein